MKNRLVITGALGHIGSKLIHSIKPNQFKEIILIDNLFTQRYCSLFNLPKSVNFKFYEQDILEANLNNLFKGRNVVIHLAAIADSEFASKHKDDLHKMNVWGTKKVALACVKNKCRLFFPSTTSIYSGQNEIITENCQPKNIKPQTQYALSKLEGEKIIVKLGQKKKLKYIIARLGTIFGPSIGMRFHTAVNKFIWQAVLSQPITIWKTAFYQNRPYLDVEDAVKAIFYLVEKDLFNNEIYNIVTINTNVNRIIKVIRNSLPGIKIKYIKNQGMNQLSYLVSNKKLQEEGFKYSGNLEKSISKTIKLLTN